MPIDIVKHWELGYRMKPVAKPYETPYTELASFEDYNAANRALLHAQYDFPNAEWRLVECWD